MSIINILIVVLGLVVFEVISSIDNAVVNADVLATMTPKWRKIFLDVGIIFAVFVVRGILPLLIVWISSPGLTLGDAFTATFSGSESVRQIIERQTPILLVGGGIFLVFLFLHWLLVEEKKYAFFLERVVHRHLYLWFYSIASILLLVTTWIALRTAPSLALGALVGSTAFFVLNGFKTQAEEAEKRITKNHLSDLAKILYLEMIDATFSIDGVLGAFAFTVSVPLILIGNGIGAFVVRYFTVHGIKTIQKYAYLKNGAMYSIGMLGAIMIIESFGGHVQMWVPPLITILLVIVFFSLSKRELAMRKDA